MVFYLILVPNRHGNGPSLHILMPSCRVISTLVLTNLRLFYVISSAFLCHSGAVAPNLDKYLDKTRHWMPSAQMFTSS
jgi:hypothetical protein